MEEFTMFAYVGLFILNTVLNKLISWLKEIFIPKAENAIEIIRQNIQEKIRRLENERSFPKVA